MSRWRQRIDEEGVVELLKQTIETTVKTGQIKKNSFQRLNVDITVQEKSMAFRQMQKKAGDGLVTLSQTPDSLTLGQMMISHWNILSMGKWMLIYRFRHGQAFGILMGTGKFLTSYDEENN